ncbi:MAG: hypothetical protein WC329_08215 [Candidatus Omnitrophota bacterium]|jgi:hypothetical protein
MKHTPGPWKIQPSSSGGALLIRQEWKPGVEYHPQSSLQIMPIEDARLISAAPEMKEHLGLMIRTIYDTLRHGLTDGQIYSLEEVCKEARAIIAKATGKEG